MTYFQATLEDKFEYNPSFVKYSFELKNPHRFTFQAGQVVKIKIKDGLDQEYFIFSSPDIDHGFEILVDQRPGKVAANGNEVAATSPAVDFFRNLQFGQVIDFTGPIGDFVISPDSQTELYLIGTGVGVAPLYSIVLDQLQVHQTTRKITLMWGLKNLDELFLEDELGELVENFANFSFHPVMAAALPEWTLCRGAVLDCLSVHEINADADFYICTTAAEAEPIKNLCLTNTVGAGQLHVATYA